MKIEPFLYWRKGAMVAAALAIGFAAWHRDSFVVACTIMAIGWALCDVVAWRDLRRLRCDCKSPIDYRRPDGTLVKSTHWCGWPCWGTEVKSALLVITPEQVRAVHRAAYMAEAINYRGHSEEQAAEAYANRQRWMNDESATTMRQHRRDALRKDDWQMAYTESHIQQAIRLGIVALVEAAAGLKEGGE